MADPVASNDRTAAVQAIVERLGLPEEDAEMAVNALIFAGWRPAAAATALAGRIDELWSAEHCAWRLQFETGMAENPWPWTALLEWTTEQDTPHGADWVTSTWQFYGETAETALREALEWVVGLAAWRRHDEAGPDPSFAGTPVFYADHLDRGRVILAADAAPSTGTVLFVGTGIRRGVPHRGPDFERGYYLDRFGDAHCFVDAVTGRLVNVDPCETVEEHGQQPLITEVLRAADEQPSGRESKETDSWA